MNKNILGGKTFFFFSVGRVSWSQVVPRPQEKKKICAFMQYKTWPHGAAIDSLYLQLNSTPRLHHRLKAITMSLEITEQKSLIFIHVNWVRFFHFHLFYFFISVWAVWERLPSDLGSKLRLSRCSTSVSRSMKLALFQGITISVCKKFAKLRPASLLFLFVSVFCFGFFFPSSNRTRIRVWVAREPAAANLQRHAPVT